MIGNIATNTPRKKRRADIIELYYDFQKAYDNVNHDYLVELIRVHGFPIGVQSLIIEMSMLWTINLSYGAKKHVGVVQLTNGIIQGMPSLPCCLSS